MLVAFLEIALGEKMESEEDWASFSLVCTIFYHIISAVRCTLVPRSKIENPESLFFMRQKTDFLTQILQFCVTDPTGGSNVDENTSSDNGEATVVTVEGGRADLPCDIEAKSADDSVYLVLWYRKNSGTPIYRFVIELLQKSFSSFITAF